MIDYFLLVSFYLLSVGGILTLIYQEYRQHRFSFHLLFSLIYLVTFYAGFPFSLLMGFGFGYQLPEISTQWKVFITSGVSYVIYYFCYLFAFTNSKRELNIKTNDLARFQAKSTAFILILLATLTLVYFLYLNGFLLFKLEKYSQLFAKNIVEAAALKRFFYFFLPGLLIFFFMYKNKTAWWTLLIAGALFGGITYLAVGGTRANLALAFIFFLFIGLYQGYLSLRGVIVAGIISLVAMFALALARYKLDVSGSEAIYTFLYLSRDTFSPWENLARLFSHPIEYQGLMPIIRDFYVYIPQSIWPERPDIAWNTANYFTKIILENQSGLAISPTILGSFYIMGGFWVVGIGMVTVAFFIKGLDKLFSYGEACCSAVIQAYCLGNLFNLIVLVREGIDAFISRFMFFSLVFLACWLIAYLIPTRQGKRND
ncbi:ECA oligosaccharide polymerase [Mannheimia sp. AT1]|uniref:ECA oligosaccharide polymerase n=1 Tax=Mannheimia cairinae TaxID=3025936 RepID=A0ABT5MTN2_9PAST|nr:ECA oligosaccharide polymerase [Mannheimia cairinae]MDD0824966.1 ECA oligosaccharide polymerase [Mannheimia cairinae]MDD0827204.1 ECA oligosaccharide polymerase [Mannheimia cairinae]